MRVSLLYSTTAVLLSTGSAVAQTVAPSQIVPRSVAPAPRVAETDSVPEPASSVQAAPADDLTVNIGDVEIRGAFPELNEANTAFAARLARSTSSLGGVFEAAGALEQAYARRGYVLARIVVPPQRISPEEPFYVLVIDGFIESIDLDAVPANIRKAVSKRLRPLVNRQHLTQAVLERQLLLAGELAGVHLRSALKRGETPGGVILTIEGQQDRVEGRVDVGNMLPASLGGWQWNSSLSFNNMLGLGDQAYFVIGSQFRFSHVDFPSAPFSMIGGGITLPIRADGTTLGVDYVRARTEPVPVDGGLRTVGRFQRATLRMSNPLILTRRESLRFNGSVSWVRQALHASDFNIDISRDDYAAGSLSLDWRKTIPHGAVAASTSFTWGMIGREGTPTTTLSRQGASASFTRLEGSFRIDRSLGGGLGLSLVGRGQSALGKPQLLSEQFSLDGRDGVSAFTSGAFNADSGFTLRGEASYVLPSAIGAAMGSPYVYAAKGRGWMTMWIPPERRTFSAASVGFGTRFGFSQSGTAGVIGFEVGRQFSSIPGRGGDVRANLTASMRF